MAYIQHLILVSVLLLAAPTSAQDPTLADRFKQRWENFGPTQEQIYEMDRFALWNNCYPVWFRHGIDDSTKLGLPVFGSSDLLKRKLEDAGLLDDGSVEIDGSLSFFEIRLDTLGQFYSVHVTFNKQVTDEATGLSSHVTTWGRALPVGMTRNPQDILDRVLDLTDLFIDEYLRVNADACE